jgi:hypothetical protein
VIRHASMLSSVLSMMRRFDWTPSTFVRILRAQMRRFGFQVFVSAHRVRHVHSKPVFVELCRTLDVLCMARSCMGLVGMTISTCRQRVWFATKSSRTGSPFGTRSLHLGIGARST